MRGKTAPTADQRVSLLSVLLSLGRTVRGDADLVLLGGPDKSAFFFCATPTFSRRFAIFRTQSGLVRPHLRSKVRFSCFPLQAVFSMAASEQVLDPTKVSCPSPRFARGFGLCHVGMLGRLAFAVHASSQCRASRRCELMEAWRAARVAARCRSDLRHFCRPVLRLRRHPSRFLKIPIRLCSLRCLHRIPL